MIMSNVQLDLTGGSAGSLFAKLKQIQQNESMASSQSSASSAARPDEASFDASKALQFDSIEHSGLADDVQNVEDPTEERRLQTGSRGAAIAVAPSEVSGDLSVEDADGDWFGYEQDAADKADFPQSPPEVWDRASQGSIERSPALIEQSPVIQPISREPSPSATTSTKKAETLQTSPEYENGVKSDAELKHQLASPHVQCQTTPAHLQDQLPSPLANQSPQVPDVSPPHSSGSICLDLEVQKGYVKRMKEKHEAREGFVRTRSWTDRQQRQTSVPLTEKEQQAQRDADIEDMQALHSRAVSLEEKVHQQEHELKEKEAMEQQLRKQLAAQAEEIKRLRTTTDSKSSAQSLGWRVEGHSTDETEREGVDWKGVAESRGQQLAELRNVVAALEEMVVVERGRAEGLEEEVQVKTAQVEELERSIAPLEALRATYMSLLGPSSWGEDWSGKEGGLEREDSSGSWAVFNGGALSPITPTSAPPASALPALSPRSDKAPAARSSSASPPPEGVSPLVSGAEWRGGRERAQGRERAADGGAGGVGGGAGGGGGGVRVGGDAAQGAGVRRTHLPLPGRAGGGGRGVDRLPRAPRPALGPRPGVEAERPAAGGGAGGGVQEVRGAGAEGDLACPPRSSPQHPARPHHPAPAPPRLHGRVWSRDSRQAQLKSPRAELAREIRGREGSDAGRRWVRADEGQGQADPTVGGAGAGSARQDVLAPLQVHQEGHHPPRRPPGEGVAALEHSRAGALLQGRRRSDARAHSGPLRPPRPRLKLIPAVPASHPESRLA